ncbi:hypothetical protein [uncultured Duncaniella sp.]|uniref:hypothetical protein n=1 Tax=uncultured Duncaniella sp. TaxID=2768039 RepID=UPI0026F40777|nr:hypothetical protein [uncultured Duncaniella sp.]
MEPIGTMIKEELERQERSVSWLARKLSCDRSNVYRLFQKHSIDTALLQRLSVILFGTEHEFSEPKGKRGGLTSMYVRCSGIGDGDVNGVMQG